jgi:hypothetical protein
MTRRRKQSTAPSGMPEDVYLLGICHLYLQNPDLFKPERDEILHKLATWFVANVPHRRLTNPELAALVDYIAPATKSLTDARKSVAQLESRTFDSVARAHQRYGSLIDRDQLKAQREAFLESFGKLETEWKKQFDAAGLPIKKK